MPYISRAPANPEKQACAPASGMQTSRAGRKPAARIWTAKFLAWCRHRLQAPPQERWPIFAGARCPNEFLAPNLARRSNARICRTSITIKRKLRPTTSQFPPSMLNTRPNNPGEVMARKFPQRHICRTWPSGYFRQSRIFSGSHHGQTGHHDGSVPPGPLPEEAAIAYRTFSLRKSCPGVCGQRLGIKSLP